MTEAIERLYKVKKQNSEKVERVDYDKLCDETIIGILDTFREIDENLINMAFHFDKSPSARKKIVQNIMLAILKDSNFQKLVSNTGGKTSSALKTYILYATKAWANWDKRNTVNYFGFVTSQTSMGFWAAEVRSKSIKSKSVVAGRKSVRNF